VQSEISAELLSKALTKDLALEEVCLVCSLRLGHK